MVQVAPIGIEGRVAFAEAAHDHSRHVGQGQRQDQQREQQADAGEPLGRADDADRRQSKAQEIGAAVAHKDAGRVEVVAQETEAAAGQRRGQQASSRLMQAEAHRQQTHCSDTAHARRQTIKTIEPVDGVGDTHQPDHRCQQA